MKILTTLSILAIWNSLCFADSNSKGKDSPLVIGKITAISDDGKTITILHQGEHSRLVTLPKDEIQYVSVPPDKQSVYFTEIMAGGRSFLGWR